MPRLLPSLLRRAALASPHQRALLTECRDINSARNELRWLGEHVSDICTSQAHVAKAGLLSQIVARRAKGEPLQYILGNQPFGDLEILCRSGVLIPRPETETYTTNVTYLLQGLREAGLIQKSGLKILDLCTGSGCIALLLYSLLTSARTPGDNAMLSPRITGVDVSQHALNLAMENLEHNIHLGILKAEARQNISFRHGDVLDMSDSLRYLTDSTWDVIISNPPYISPADYAPGGRTTRSVREYEPRLALVPPSTAGRGDEQADIFYHAILQAARKLRPKLLCMEVGDPDQASRVALMAANATPHAGMKPKPDNIEIWCDDGSVHKHSLGHKSKQQKSSHGLERAVVVWRDTWAEWRNRHGS